MIFQSISSTKRFLAYVIPVTITSFALNIPKFLEVEIKGKTHEIRRGVQVLVFT